MIVIVNLVPASLANHTPRSAETVARDLYAQTESKRRVMDLIEREATFAINDLAALRWRELGRQRWALFEKIRTLGFGVEDFERWEAEAREAG